MHCNIKALVLVLVFGNSLSARSQDKMMSGTVIVTGISQTKIVVAADSRRIPPFGPPDDNVCKILALDDKSIFAASGNTLSRRGDVTFWDAYDRTGAIFRSTRQSKGSTGFLRSASVAWSKDIISRINLALVNGNVKIAGLEENRFFNAVFIGFEGGSAAIYQQEIMYDLVAQKAVSKPTYVQPTVEIKWGAMGHPETAYEVLAGQTIFAKMQMNAWNARRLSIRSEDQDANFAIFLTKASMIYNPHRDEIGGPINALEITSRGTRWIDNPTCKQN